MSDDTAVIPPGDRANVSVFVAVAPAVAFEVFTQEIDLWWKRGPQFRIAGARRGMLHFEPGVGGRLFESFELGEGDTTREQVFEVGRITAWEPAARLEFEWRGVNFKPGEKTVVEVRFEPRRRGTLVSVQHRGWSALPSDHPARHGLQGPAFSRMIGLWWGDLMTALREHVSASPDSG
jgi:hypothetical protein